MIFGISEPAFIIVLALAAVFLLKILPYIKQKVSKLTYSEFNIKNSNAFFTYLGRGGIGFNSLKLSKPPVNEGNYRYTLFLEGLPKGIEHVNLSPDDPDKDYRLHQTFLSIIGVRQDVFLRIDANGDVYEWADVATEDMLSYENRNAERGKSRVLTDAAQAKEIEESLKDDPAVKILSGKIK